jgi:hypothetical protein
MPAAAPERGAVLLLLFLAGVAWGADVPTFLIQADLNSQGNAFVVKDWRSGRSGRHLLLTALHVLYGKTSANVMRVNCSDASSAPLKTEWFIDAGTEVLTWPQYDLAAIEIPDDGSIDLDEELAGEVEFTSPREDETTFVHVHATSKLSVCQAGMGFLMGRPVAEKLARHLATHSGEVGRGTSIEVLTQRARGSLASNTPLLVYFSPSAPGTSGAAVTLPSRRKAVIGVHNAGYTNASISWAVAFAGLSSPLAQPQAIARLGQAGWPTFASPRLTQSLTLDAFPEDVQASALRSTRQSFLDAVWMLEMEAQRRILAQMVRVSYTYEVTRLPETHQFLGLGLRVAYGYRWSRSREQAIGPDGRILREGPLWATGFFLEPELELRLLRLSQFRPALGFGARLWSADYVRWKNPTQSMQPALAGNLRLYFTPKNNLPVSVLAELRIVRGWEILPVYTYTGIGANVDTHEEAAVWLMGAAFGVVY